MAHKSLCEPGNLQGVVKCEWKWAFNLLLNSVCLCLPGAAQALGIHSSQAAREQRCTAGPLGARCWVLPLRPADSHFFEVCSPNLFLYSFLGRQKTPGLFNSVPFELKSGNYSLIVSGWRLWDLRENTACPQEAPSRGENTNNMTVLM